MQIGFIGLGNMGTAIAGNLLKAGHQLTVWNRSPAAVAEPHVRRTGRRSLEVDEAPVPALAAERVETVLERVQGGRVATFRRRDQGLFIRHRDSGSIQDLHGPRLHGKRRLPLAGRERQDFLAGC